VSGPGEAVRHSLASLCPQVDHSVDHCRFSHQQIHIRLRFFLYRHQHVLVPHRRIAVRQLRQPRLAQPAFDPAQGRLNCPARQLPRALKRRRAFRIIPQVISEFRARAAVAQAARLVHDYRIRRRTVFETLQIPEIERGCLIAHPPLQSQRNTLPSPEISRIALGWRGAPARIPQGIRSGLKQAAHLISHGTPIVTALRKSLAVQPTPKVFQ